MGEWSENSPNKLAHCAHEPAIATLTPSLSHPPSAVLLRRTGRMGEGGPGLAGPGEGQVHGEAVSRELNIQHSTPNIQVKAGFEVEC
jgi:hypothetical protein